jgi:hypothetical protein
MSIRKGIGKGRKRTFKVSNEKRIREEEARDEEKERVVCVEFVLYG